MLCDHYLTVIVQKILNVPQFRLTSNHFSPSPHHPATIQTHLQKGVYNFVALLGDGPKVTGGASGNFTNSGHWKVYQVHNPSGRLPGQHHNQLLQVFWSSLILRLVLAQRQPQLAALLKRQLRVRGNLKWFFCSAIHLQEIPSFLVNLVSLTTG